MSEGAVISTQLACSFQLFHSILMCLTLSPSPQHHIFWEAALAAPASPLYIPVETVGRQKLSSMDLALENILKCLTHFFQPIEFALVSSPAYQTILFPMR